MDFSLRRTQGRDAGLKVARASYLAGFLGTSNVLAGKLYGIPIFGTMAHSYISSFPEEIEAFRVFSRVFPAITTLLIDTYDNISGARHAVRVAQEMEARGQRLEYVRLDSGDMAAISQEVRQILDEPGLDYVRILASGGFDEHKIARVLADGARIDGFAVGTKMGVSADAPYFDIAYKLVKYAGRPVMKLSTGKVTLVDKKQVFRHYDDQGAMRRDVIALRRRGLPGAKPLLQPVMAKGRIIRPQPTLKESRDIFRPSLPGCPRPTRPSRTRPLTRWNLSPGLRELQSRVESKLPHGNREKVKFMGLTESLCYYNTLFINQCSYGGIFVLMALESMVFPIPSELVMPFAGFLIFSGAIRSPTVMVASSLGSVAGSLLSYGMGRLGEPVVLRYGRYLLLNRASSGVDQKIF